MANMINSEYHRFTQSLKTFMSDCKADTNSEVLCNILNYSTKNQRGLQASESPKTFSPKTKENGSAFANKLKLLKVQVYDVPTLQRPVRLEISAPIQMAPAKSKNHDLSSLSVQTEDDTSFRTAKSDFPSLHHTTTTDAEVENSFKTAKDASFCLNQPVSTALGKNAEKHRRKFKSKVEYFEMKLAATMKTSGALPQFKLGVTSTPKEAGRRPLIIRQDFMEQSIVEPDKIAQDEFDSIDEDLDATYKSLMIEYKNETVMKFREKIDFFDEFFRTHLFCEVGHPANKNSKGEQFIVNLYQPKMVKKLEKVKSSTSLKGGLVQMNSKLHIKDMSTVHDVFGLELENLPLMENSDAEATYEEIDNSTSANVHLGTTNGNSDSSSNITLDRLKDVDLPRKNNRVTKSQASLVSSLMREVHIQGQILIQATKAVQECKRIKTLTNSLEQLEAERILLIAGLTREFLLEEIREIRCQALTETSYNDYGARLTIFKLELPLLVFLDDYKHHKEYFIVTCSVDSVIQASHVIERKPTSSVLNCHDEFTFEHLGLTSVVNVWIYQVQIKSTNNQRRCLNLSCLKSESRMDRRSQTIEYKDAYSGLVKDAQILPSMFRLCGTLCITVEDLLKSSSFVLNDNFASTTLSGKIKLTNNLSPSSASGSVISTAC